MTHARPSKAESPANDLMTPAEVARLFGVTAKTASRWADQGHLDSVRTLGGNRRFLTAQVHRLYREYLRRGTSAPGSVAGAEDVDAAIHAGDPPARIPADPA